MVAVGAAYTSFEGYKDEATGETVIGLSYDKLCQHVKQGGRILMADGSLTLEVRRGNGRGRGAARPALHSRLVGACPPARPGPRQASRRISAMRAAAQ